MKQKEDGVKSAGHVCKKIGENIEVRDTENNGKGDES